MVEKTTGASSTRSDFSVENSESLKDFVLEVLNQKVQANTAIIPRVKFINALRHNTMTNEQAVFDLLDNSLDTDVNASKIYLRYKKNQYLSIADNGVGMSRDLLIDALKLGSQGRDIPTADDLGLYGIGLKNSSLSLGRRLVVISKTKETTTTAIYDMDDIIKAESFSIPVYESTTKEVNLFNEHTVNAQTGTVILITRLDRIMTNNETQFVNLLKKGIGETFRIFIKDGKEIFVNGAAINVVDPLGDIGTFKTQITEQRLTFKRPDSTEFGITVKWGFLPRLLDEEVDKLKKSDIDDDEDLSPNLDRQGFYFMRNGRQLGTPSWLGLRRRHNQLNRLRIEIHATGVTDDIFYINFEKNTLHLHQWFKDQLKERVKTTINSYLIRSKNDSKPDVSVDDKVEVIFKRIKDAIDSRSNRIPKLKKKNIQDELVKSKSPQEEAAALDNPQKKTELINFEWESMQDNRFICQFYDFGDGSVTITWNINHVFYPSFLDLNISTQITFCKFLLAFGRAVIDLSSQTEDYEKIMVDFQLKIGEEFRKMID